MVSLNNRCIKFGNMQPAMPDVEALVKQEAKAIVKAIKRHRCQQEEEVGKEPTMSNQYDDIQNTRRYLERQINSISSFHAENELARKYGLYDDPAPSSGKEIVERILAGKYILPEEHLEWNYPHGIQWRDPNAKKDRDGFEADMKKLKEATCKALDIATVLTPVEGLAAVEDLRTFVKELTKVE